MRKALSINPEDAVLENDLAACLATEKKYSESIEMCIKILQKYPTYEYPKDYIRQIFSVWDDKEKVTYYKFILTIMPAAISVLPFLLIPACVLALCL